MGSFQKQLASLKTNAKKTANNISNDIKHFIYNRNDNNELKTDN